MISIRARSLRFAAVFLLLSGVLSPPGQSQESQPDTPVGLWETIDDATGEPLSQVEIWEEGGVLAGKIIRLVDPGEPEPVCDQCSGDLHGQPIVGLTILRNLKRDGKKWSGGTILDPGNGKTYKASLELEEAGRRLKVRGFIGISLLGRTQYWNRVG